MGLAEVSAKEWISFFAALFTFVYVFAALFLVVWLRSRRQKEFDVFSNALTRGIETSKVVSVSDCLDIAKGISIQIEDAELRPKVIRWLHKYLLQVVSDQVVFSQGTKSSSAKDLVTSFIRDLEKTDPFSQLPTAERGVVSDIVRSIESKNLLLAVSKTNDLAGLIEARSDHVKRLEKLNRWSMPLAVAGIVLTIIFGIASLT